jgi:DNA-directed RNA polymerase specialized sigma24 family protein
MTEESLVSLECLCERDSCEMVVGVIPVDLAAQHGQRLQCQHCNRLFVFPWTEWQWKSRRLVELIEQAQAGDEDAMAGVCEFVDSKLKPGIKSRLRAAGTPWNEIDDKFQEVCLRMLERLLQLRDAYSFRAWLFKIASDIGRASNRRRERQERPELIGERSICIDGREHLVRVFEAHKPQEHLKSREPQFVELSDSLLAKRGKTIAPDYTRNIDRQKTRAELQKALAKLTGRKNSV